MPRKLSRYLRGLTTEVGIRTSRNFVIATDERIADTAEVKLQVNSGAVFTGNAGIGSTNPQAKLDVVGDIKVSGDLNIGVGATISTPNDNELSFNTNSAERLRITGIGSVGIGVTDPYYFLDIRFNDNTTELSGGASGNWDAQGLRLENDNTTIGSMSLMHFRSGNNADWHVGTKFYGTANSDFIMLEEGVEKLRITNEGRVGIGTDAPNANLEIWGDTGLYIQSATSATEAKIRLSSHISSEIDYSNPFADDLFQYGTISYTHSDTDSGDYYSGNTYNERFLIQGSETRTKFQVNGDIWSVTEDGASGRFACIDGVGRFYSSVTTGLLYHPDGTRTYTGSETGHYSYVNDATTYTYIAAREANDWSASFHSKYAGVNRHGFYGNGVASHYNSMYIGRVFDNGTSSTPSSDYNSGEYGIQCNASASNDRTYMYGRNVADTSQVFLSEVNGEDNIEFTAAGNGYWDGSADNGPADYAEYFEWADGNPNNEDRVGKTVVIVPNTNGKIGIASTTDDASLIIGAVSGRPAIVGDSAHFAWHGRYRTDEFNRRITETVEIYTYEGVDGELERVRKDKLEEGFEIPDNWTLTTAESLSLSDDYDPSMDYTPREDRPEWSPIGLLGKLTVYKDQIKGDRWIKMEDINEQLEKWLVR